jgi:uncharacterized protein
MIDKTENDMKNLLKDMDFKCQRCSDCCRIDPGVVLLTENDADTISRHLKTGRDKFISEYCRAIERNGKFNVSLKEKPNYDCIFWNGSCLIYEARPLQCRTYPYWPGVVESRHSWNDEAKRCAGINKPGVLTLLQRHDLYLQEMSAEIMEYPVK